MCGPFIDRSASWCVYWYLCMQNLLSLHELVKARLHCRAMHEGSDPTATLILRLIASNHAITRLLVSSIPWILEWDSCNYSSSIAWRGLLICAHVHLSLFCVLLTLWRICHSPSTNHVCIIGRANESCMHLFLRIQTLAQILGYRLFSLTYSYIKKLISLFKSSIFQPISCRSRFGSK